MTLSHATPTHRISHSIRPTPLLAGIAVAALFPLALASATRADAADVQVDLGTAKAFSVLAGSGVTNTGVTSLEGSLGSYETPTITTDTPFVFTGADASNHADDGVTQQAKSDLLVAYDAVAGALPPTAVPQELSRIDPYLPGIYRASSSMLLSGAMTLDGGGRNDGVFIFQAPTSTLTTASNATVLFVNGAQPCNVYWQVGSSATFGTGTTFVGNVLAHTTITAGTGAIFEGRLLAGNGAVNLDNNTIIAPGCDTTVDPDDDDDDVDPGPTNPTSDTGVGGGSGTGGGSPTGTGAATDAGTGTGSVIDEATARRNAAAADRSDSYLPDVGGTSLALLAASLLMVMGGIAFVRRGRVRPSHRR